MTTLTDEKDKSRAVRYFGWRNFDGLLQLTEPNKQEYAAKHGYYWFDESAVLDKSRPPSWSKIRAVQRLLNEEQCDWVFWLDADTVIMDSSRPLESILSSEHDLLVAPDDGGGYNAGVWLIRNTEWSKDFLQTWWDMKSFVLPPGLSKSGDNDALKHYLAQLEGSGEFAKHVAAPARCTFNSFARFVNPSASKRVNEERNKEWHLKEGYYHDGDFIAHVAAVDNKVDTIRIMLALSK